MSFTDDFLNDVEGFVDYEKESEGETPAYENIVNDDIEINIQEKMTLVNGRQVLDPAIKEFYKNYQIFYDVISGGNYLEIEKLMSKLKKNDTIRERLKFFEMFHFSDSDEYRNDVLPILLRLMTEKVKYEHLREKQKAPLIKFFERVNRSFEKIGYPLKPENFNHNFNLYNRFHSSFISFFHADNIFNYSANYLKPSNYYYLYKIALNSIKIQNSINKDGTFVFYSNSEKSTNKRNEALFFVMKRLFEEDIKFTCHKANATDFRTFINVIYTSSFNKGDENKILKIEKYINLFNTYNDSEVKIEFSPDINLFTLSKGVPVIESEILYELHKQKNVLKGLWNI